MVRLQGEQAADARHRQRNPGGPLPFFTLNPKFIVQREKGEKMKFSKAILTVLALLIFSVSGALMAQPSRAGQEIQGPPEGAVVGDSKPASRLPTDEDLISFAQAYRKVVQIRKEIGPRLKDLQNDAKKKQLKKEAGQKMRKAITGTGLTVKRFNQIIQKLDTDPDLRKRLESLLQKGKDSDSPEK